MSKIKNLLIGKENDQLYITNNIIIGLGRFLKLDLKAKVEIDSNTQMTIRANNNNKFQSTSDCGSLEIRFENEGCESPIFNGSNEAFQDLVREAMKEFHRRAHSFIFSSYELLFRMNTFINYCKIINPDLEFELLAQQLFFIYLKDEPIATVQVHRYSNFSLDIKEDASPFAEILNTLDLLPYDDEALESYNLIGVLPINNTLNYVRISIRK